MPGVSVSISFDDAAIAAALDRLAALAAAPAPVLTAIGTGLVASAERRFISNTAPDGSPWKALSLAYDAFRRPGPILVQSGALRRSITFRLGASEVSVGSPMVYAAVHQFGATIKPKQARALTFRLAGQGKVIRVASVTIPARPYLGISADDAEMAVEAAEDIMRAAFNG